MKKMLACLTLLFLPSLAMSDPLLGKMEKLNSGAIAITFTDFADAEGFDRYSCNVDFGWSNQFFVMPANRIADGRYRCVDGGGYLQSGFYDVSITFHDSWSDTKSDSPILRLRVE